MRYFSHGLHHSPIVCHICSLSQLAACELKYQNYPAPVIEVYFSPQLGLEALIMWVDQNNF